MDEQTFMQYIQRFNEADDTAFDDYIHPDLHMKNGTLEFTGVEGMKHHYRDLIWGNFTEFLDVKRFLGDGNRIAIQLRTLFTARKDMAESLFGPVLEGETFEFNGVVMYEVLDGKLRDALVAYNSFEFTNAAGEKRDLGIPH